MKSPVMAAIEIIQEHGLEPVHALAMCVLMSLGGEASEKDIIRGMMEWKVEWGPPTWEKLFSWEMTTRV